MKTPKLYYNTPNMILGTKETPIYNIQTASREIQLAVTALRFFLDTAAKRKKSYMDYVKSSGWKHSWLIITFYHKIPSRILKLLIRDLKAAGIKFSNKPFEWSPRLYREKKLGRNQNGWYIGIGPWSKVTQHIGYTPGGQGIHNIQCNLFSLPPQNNYKNPTPRK